MTRGEQYSVYGLYRVVESTVKQSALKDTVCEEQDSRNMLLTSTQRQQGQGSTSQH